MRYQMHNHHPVAGPVLSRTRYEREAGARRIAWGFLLALAIIVAWRLA